jgi:hypothetical protein
VTALAAHAGRQRHLRRGDGGLVRPQGLGCRTGIIKADGACVPMQPAGRA